MYLLSRYRLYLCLSVFLCGNSMASAIRVVDYLGRDVILQKPAERIVALAPHIVENLFSAGAGDKVVGTVDYADYPESAKRIPRVGAISAYSIESILALKPDLVIVWYSGRGGKILHKLESLGLTVYADNPESLKDVSRSIRDMGQMAGSNEVAHKVAVSFDERHNELALTNHKKAQIRVLYQVWHQPLQTLNGEHIISDIIRLCGGQNVFSGAIPIAPKISVESVLQVDPQVIVASGMGATRPEWLDAWLRWSSISAVRHNQLYFIPPDLIQRHTHRILDGAEMMCSHMDLARRKL